MSTTCIPAQGQASLATGYFSARDKASAFYAEREKRAAANMPAAPATGIEALFVLHRFAAFCDEDACPFRRHIHPLRFAHNLFGCPPHGAIEAMLHEWEEARRLAGVVANCHAGANAHTVLYASLFALLSFRDGANSAAGRLTEENLSRWEKNFPDDAAAFKKFAAGIK